MADLFENVWNFFREYTDLFEDFSSLSAHRDIIFGVIFGLAVLLGFFFFRVYFAAVFFLIFVAASVALLSPIASWQNTVAFFSVNGVIFAYLSFKWVHLAAFADCTAIGALIGGLITGSYIGAIIFGLLFMILCILFPLHSVCIAMPLFGTLGIVSLFELPIWLGIIMMVIGTGLQFSFAVNQKIFPKTMPDSLRYRLEKRKSHAAGV